MVRIEKCEREQFRDRNGRRRQERNNVRLITIVYNEIFMHTTENCSDRPHMCYVVRTRTFVLPLLV